VAKPLEQLEFLIGKWGGTAEGFGSDSGSLTSTAAFKYEPGRKIISGYRESREGRRLQNRVLMLFLYDNGIGKFVRKDVYSYGFIVNQIGEQAGNRFNFESVGIDSEPDFYKGVGFRSFVEKVSANAINLGIENAKQGKAYTLYGQQKLKRLQ
jgi:hypothetical protein